MVSLGEPTASGTEAEANQLSSPIAIAIAITQETFLRDLISSSSDALDQAKKSKSGPYAHGEFFICLIPDKFTKTLTVADSGVGMTRSDLFKHVGVIARCSVTDDFTEADVSMVGVRFFPACLVADKVVVTTKDVDGQQYLFAWERGSFAVGLDADGERLHRGTEIKMFLKDDHLEYLDERRLKDLVNKYSASIAYPIYLLTGKAGGGGGADEWVQINKPVLLYKVLVCVEGVPPHARRLETVAGLLARFGLVVEGLDGGGGGGARGDKVAACVCAWVWTHDPDAVPRVGTLFIRQPPGPIWPSSVHSDHGLAGCPPCAAGPPRMLVYQVIIHVDRVYDYSGGDGGGDDGDLWPRCRIFPWDLGVLDGVAPPF